MRAYREAALKGIEASGIIEKFYEEEISFFVDYEFFGGINKMIQKYQCKILEKKLENNAFFKISIRKRDKENFLNEILKKTKGNVTIQKNCITTKEK